MTDQEREILIQEHLEHIEEMHYQYKQDIEYAKKFERDRIMVPCLFIGFWIGIIFGAYIATHN